MPRLEERVRDARQDTAHEIRNGAGNRRQHPGPNHDQHALAPIEFALGVAHQAHTEAEQPRTCGACQETHRRARFPTFEAPAQRQQLRTRKNEQHQPQDVEHPA